MARRRWRHVLQDRHCSCLTRRACLPIGCSRRRFGDYSASQYDSAIAGFQQLVKNFPTAERADDAQFFIGESLGKLNRLPEAIDAYNVVIEKFPTGDQIDMAYYRRGFVESQMGRADAARATFEEVVKRLPNSQGAQLARQRLAGSPRPPASAPNAKP